MSFPSRAIKSWCKNIQKLIDSPRKNKTTYNDGFCMCEVEKAILYAPGDKQAQLTSGLFWSVWIDQVMYYVLIDGGVNGFLPEPELYRKFRSIYCFPKFYVHSGPGHSSPHFLLGDNQHYQKPDEYLLKEDKNDFWCEVKKWLMSIHRDDVVNAVISAFREDIENRFENKYSFLWENLECI